MSVSQYQRNVNSLDKEISDLSEKKSTVDKDCAALQKKIANARKDLTRTKSPSTISSKNKQISYWLSELAKKQDSSANYEKQIAQRMERRNAAYQKLQRASANETAQQLKNNARIRQSQEQSFKQELRVLSASNFPDTTPQSSSTQGYDVFISHAWEDKANFVDEFVEKLEDLNLRVWYDTTELKWGDSMRARIDEGLRKSKFGVVILSPNYIADGKYWTKEELNGLFQLESINGKKLLPIWHNLTKNQIMEFSPMIADKKAMTTATMTAEEIAAQLKKLLDESISPQQNPK